ncbi:MAG: DUF4352 domain-containing protein [Bacillota bacterium]
MGRVLCGGMKSAWACALMVALTVAVSGCFGPGESVIPVLNWSLAAKDWTTTSYVDHALFPGQGLGYTARPGYEWLVIGVAVSNTSGRTQNLNPFIYEMRFVPASGLIYTNQLALYDPIGGLAWSDVQPWQTIYGDVFFEVPAGTTVQGARLVLYDTIEHASCAISLGDLPRRQN